MTNINENIIPSFKLKSYKVVLIGDSFVGKTSIVKILLSNKDSELKPSIGALNYKYIITENNNESYFLDLWDTAGQERFKSVVPMYYRGSKAIIVVYDITNIDTFEGAKQWVREIESQNSNSCLFLLGNKSDLFEQRKVLIENAKSFANEHKMIFFECSALENINVKEIFYYIAESIPKSEIVNTKIEKIENIKQKKKRYICC